MTNRRVYVVVNRTTGYIYGVTQNLERARNLLENALRDNPAAIVSITDEPILP